MICENFDPFVSAVALSELEFMLFFSVSMEEIMLFGSMTRPRDHSSEIRIDTPGARHMKSLLVPSAYLSAAVSSVEKEARD